MSSTKIINKFILLNSKGENDIIDITNNVKRVLLESQLKNGIVTLFVVGSTAAITTIEYEQGLQKRFSHNARKNCTKGN